MTDIKFFKKNNIFSGFECSGHTGYDRYGKDILCASISSITQSIALGLREVCDIDIKITRRDSDGYIKVELPEEISNDKLDKSQVLLLTLYESIEDLVSGYSKYIKMEVIENVY